ncbi:MAG TPA: 2-oxo acid dehydrogenase subunit E2 [Devosia sp.]|nr:2-oxo acid dehydrogenase subunit E2 [Devosia sp.]
MPDASDSRILPYGKLRRGLAVTMRSAAHLPTIHAFVEIDVTMAREWLHTHPFADGGQLSFTAFIAHNLARAVSEQPEIQALRRGGRQIEIFNDVDVALMVERDVDDRKQPVVAIVRHADGKPLRAIHDEIRAAQRGDIAEVWDGYKSMGWLPLFVIRLGWPLLWWLIRRRPSLYRRYRGTVGISAIGMFGKGGGWGLPFTTGTQLTLGGISRKPVVVGDTIAIREILDMTVSFDHALVDGGNAARFVSRLRELIESANGLGSTQ